MTRFWGLEAFFINPNEMAEELRNTCATSASVAGNPYGDSVDSVSGSRIHVQIASYGGHDTRPTDECRRRCPGEARSEEGVHSSPR